MLQVFYLPWLVNFAGPNYGLILELDRNGYITRSFQDPTGSVVPGHISEVYDDGNVLYLGSYQSSFLGKLELKDWCTKALQKSPSEIFTFLELYLDSY